MFLSSFLSSNKIKSHKSLNNKSFIHSQQNRQTCKSNRFHQPTSYFWNNKYKLLNTQQRCYSTAKGIRFGIDENTAVRSLQHWKNSLWLGPSPSKYSNLQVEKWYLPFWIFKSRGTVFYSAEITRQRGIKHQISGELEVRNLEESTYASEEFERAYLDSMNLPWPHPQSRTASAPITDASSQYSVDLYTVDEETAWEKTYLKKMKKKIRNIIQDELRRTYPNVATKILDFIFEPWEIQSYLRYYPMYVFSFEFFQRILYCYVDGFKGKTISGERLFSFSKVGMLSMVCVTLWNNARADGMLPWVDCIAGAIPLSLLIATAMYYYPALLSSIREKLQHLRSLFVGPKQFYYEEEEEEPFGPGAQQNYRAWEDFFRERAQQRQAADEERKRRQRARWEEFKRQWEQFEKEQFNERAWHEWQQQANERAYRQRQQQQQQQQQSQRRKQWDSRGKSGRRTHTGGGRQQTRASGIEQEIAQKKDFYSVLGLDPHKRTSYGASELKKAYHKMAMKWHPDKHQGTSRDEASRKFKEINQAFQVLSKPNQKQLYDKYGRSAVR